MSTKGAKGKGKSRGGGMSSQSHRSQHSRNSTPASGSAFSAETVSSDLSGSVSYADISERLSLADNPSIPSAATLAHLGADLKTLHDQAKVRSQVSDKAMRKTQGRLEAQKARDEVALAEKERKAAVEDLERKERVKLKKRKNDPDHKRPHAVGAHQPTGQGPASERGEILC